MTRETRKLVAATMAAVLAWTLFATTSSLPVHGATTEMVRVAGNPKCSDNGFLGLKIDGAAPVGTYEFAEYPGVSVTIGNTSGDGRTFDWESTFGLDQVIVKGGDAANVYSYSDARSDSDLTSPVNNSGQPAKISHVEFCTDGVVTPTISASTDSVGGARGVDIRDIDLTALPANLLNAVAGADLVNDAGTGLRFSGTSLRFSGTGLRFSGTGLRFSGTGLRFSGTGLRFSGTSLRFSGTSLRFSGTGLRFSGTSLRFSGDGVGALVDLRSADTGLRFSGTGLRFSGTGLRSSAIPAWDIPLSDLQPPAGYSWEDVFAAIAAFEGVLPQNVTFGQLLDALDADFSALTGDDLAVIEALAGMSLLDLDPNGAILRDVSLVALLLGNTPLTAIPLPDGQQWCRIIDPEFTTCTDAGSGTDADPGIGDSTMLGLNLAGLRSDNLPLDEIAIDGIAFDPDSVIADLLVDDPADASDLYVPAEPGDTLATYLIRGIDALNVPWEQLPLIDGFDVRQFAFGEPVSFTSSWAQLGSSTTPVSVTAPAGFVLAGQPTCVVDVGTCTVAPTTGAGTDTFEVRTESTGIQQVTLQLTYRPKGLLGEANAPTSGLFAATVGSGSGEFPVGLTDPWAGQSPPPIDPDVLYFAEATGGALDTYDVDVTPYAPGSHVAVRISNLTDDADLVLYRSAGTSLRFSGTGMRFSGTSLRFSGTGLRFSGDTGDQSVESLESETLEDVPIDQGLLVEDVSANRSSTPEAAEGFTSPDTSNFQVQVSGFNQASTEYVLRVAVTEFGDACPAPASISTSVEFDVPGSTVVLYPRERFQPADQAVIDAALANLKGFWPGLSVGTVTTTGADWTTEEGACSVFAANSVAEDVARAVRDRSASQPIEHVMIIGSDDKLPFYRTADTTLIANESNYASTVGGQNPLTAAFATQHVLTDDIYGDNDPWPFLNRLYFTPDRAVGRLVESAADIAGQINQFVTSKGLIAVDRAFTAGYDFLSDAAIEIDANLGNAKTSTSTNSLISDIGAAGVPDWTIADLTGALKNGGTGDDVKIASINGHMDQGLLLSAAGDAQGDNPDASEVEGPDVVIPSGINGAVMFTAGCHAGTSQPYANALRTDDWAQAVAGGPAAVYLANTGYGYGLDQPVVGYSEELLVSFSDLLATDGLTVGQAAMFAKQQYFSNQLEIDPYDEKSQMQLTTYGVPMYSLTAPQTVATTQALATETSATTVTETVTDPITGLQIAAIDATNVFGPRAGGDGTNYYELTGATVNGLPAEIGLEAANGNPIQPKFSADVTVPDMIARGAFIESLTSRRENLDNPTIARATVDNTSSESPADAGVLIFPTAFANVQTEQTPDGPRGKLVVVPAQYDSTNGLEQLLIESLELTTYYAPDSIDTVDIVRPQFSDVSANASNGDVLFRASVSDPDDPGKNIAGTGVQRVLVQYFDGTAWNAVEMFPANEDRTEWSGGLRVLAPGATNGVFFVQAVDGAGNVAVTANKGNNYDTGGDPAQAVAFVSGTEGDNGWYVGAATVELKGSAVELPSADSVGSHLVTVNGGAEFRYSVPIELTTEGINVVTITGPGAAPITVVVPIDTRAPIVDLDTPIVVLSLGDTVAPAKLLTCTDPVPGSGLRDLDPNSGSFCSLTEDEYSLVLDADTDNEQTIGPFTLSSARGQDVAGNETTESQSAVILSGTKGEGGFYTSPVILGIIGAAAADAEVSVDGGEFEKYVDSITIGQESNIVVKIGDDTISFDVDVDQVAPTALVTPDPEGQTYDIGQVVPVTCTFTDSGSGLASVTCGSETFTGTDLIVNDSGEVVVTTTLDTSTAGSKTFVVAATDVAGNTTSKTSTYTVRDPFCDPQGDAVRADLSDDIIRCETVVNDDRTATISIIVAGEISSSKLQYRLDLASDPTKTGAQVKWSEGKTTGKGLLSAEINPTDPSRLDFVVDLARIGVATGGTLYWSAAVQSGEKGAAGAGFLDLAPDAGYFSLPT